MDPLVKKHIEEQKAIAQQKKNEEIKEALLEAGLFYKVYSPNDFYTDEYPFFDWDEKTSKSRYYKKEVPELTNEEYEEFKQQLQNKNQSNPVALILKIIAIVIFVVGFIAGIALAKEVKFDLFSSNTRTDFNFIVALVSWSIYFVMGMMFLGFAEIIKLLQDIKNK